MKIKNRGAITNPAGRFESRSTEVFYDGWDSEEENPPTLETTLFQENAKSIITRNDSPDIGFEQSINPYKGCEHGCIYCYARPSHGYLNLSSGLDFETKIFYKPNSAELLESELNKKNYHCRPIVLGSNTDPYQPAEKELKITRSLLEILNHYNHPAVIITKSSMIERDADILAEMAKRSLINVAISVTTLSNSLKLILEPRASGPKGRLHAIHTLSSLNIPIRVMAAPMIPMINDMELEAILKECSKAGAAHASYVLVRLPYEVKELFKEWLATHYPDRANHVMNLIKDMRGGKEYDATFGKRMRGEGEFANLLAARFRIACKKFNLNTTAPPSLETNLFKKIKNTSQQLDLFSE